jgi:hypothetical protein
VEIEGVVAHGFDPGDHDGQVLGAAAGHDRVDRDLLDGGAAEIRRHQRDQLAGLTARARDHRGDALARGRNDGKAVGDAALEESLEGILLR